MLNFQAAKDEFVTSVTWSPDPVISPRRILASDSSLVVYSKKLFPLRFKRGVRSTIRTSIGRTVRLFVSPFNYDGATYPKKLQIFLGKGTQPSYRKASALHDYMMNHKKELLSEFEGVLTYQQLRQISSSAFKRALIEDGVSVIQASIMSFFMHLWQVFGNSKAWRRK